MKKLFITGMLFLLFVSLASAFINLTSVNLGPSTAYTTTDLKANVTCDGSGDLTVHWNVFNGSTNVTSLAGDSSIVNDTETLAVTIPSSIINKGEIWKVKAWCVNNDSEKTAIATSNTVTVQNTAPVAASASLAPGSGTPTTLFTCSGTASDADNDALTKQYRFLKGTTVLQAWSTGATYQCSTSTCNVGSSVKCQMRANDGTVYSDLVNSSSANINAPSLSLTISDLALGGSSQEKSNPDEDDDEYITTSGTVTVTNTGSIDMTQVDIANLDVGSKYNVTFNPNTINNLQAGDSETVTVRIIVPEDADAFDPDRSNAQADRAFNIGKIKATGTDGSSTATDNSQLTLEVENKLEIYKLYISVDDDESKYSDDDLVEDIMPGAEIKVRLQAETKYTSSSNVDLDNIEFRIEIDDGDIDEEESEDIPDIDAGDDEEEGELSFDIEDDVDEDTYTMIITLEGEDSYGSVHGEQWEIDLEVKKEKKKIDIKSLDLSPETLSCNRISTLTAKIENIGKDDSDEIVLEIKNDQLGIYSKTTNIDLDDGDDYTKTYTIEVGDSVGEGVYQIKVYTYFDDDDYDDNDISTFESVNLVVQDCGTDSNNNNGGSTDNNNNADDNGQEDDQDDNDDDSGIIIDNTPSGSDTNIPQEGGVVAREPVSVNTGMDDTTFYILVGLGYVVVIVIGISLLAALFRKR